MHCYKKIYLFSRRNRSVWQSLFRLLGDTFENTVAFFLVHYDCSTCFRVQEYSDHYSYENTKKILFQDVLNEEYGHIGNGVTK